ncbi:MULTISPECIES: restriction endonuclease subunit S [Lachnospiraceae]|uniref:Restriction endonuclease subunit S n=1 Tax=Blautia parvula TaxID=2877527 RepID=A0ABQ0BPW2_9FIRM
MWTRLGNLCAAIQYGLSNSAEPKGSHKFLRITDIQNGTVNWDTVPFTRTSDPDVYLLKPGDIVFARTGATVGKSFLITETPYPSVYASYLIRIRLLGDLLSEYIYQFFDSACYWSQITDKSVGVGQPNCNGTALKELFIPLPPINEQLRIIPTVRKLLKRVTKIDTEEKALISIVTAAKAKILDLAIRGKLVPQNPDDEPASALLERIRTEREELIKQRKIKRDKKESFIFKGEDNSYYEMIGNKVNNLDNSNLFDLPDNWCWCRVRSIADVKGGKRLPKGCNFSDTSTNHAYIRVTDMKNHTVNTTNLRYISDEVYEQIKSYIISKNDLYITIAGTIGTVGEIPDELDNMNLTENAAKICNIKISKKYLCYILSSQFVQVQFQEKTHQVAMPKLALERILTTIIPIPPYKEQLLIAKKIEDILHRMNAIENSIC